MHDDTADQRQPGQRDRDRILYTTSFRRMAGVTQVATPIEGHIFHNRLTHTLEVAQFARRLAEKLMDGQNNKAEQRGGIDPEVVEAAAFAHDLGHPPFGHIAEDELDVLARKHGAVDGFEGNAQSFRILTKVAAHRSRYKGLNLTRATLNAVLKYPWMRDLGDPTSKKFRKFGAYRSENREFEFARSESAGSDVQSIEAAIMDYADEVAYCVHDLEDFYRAGLIPLERLVLSNSEFEAFLTRWSGQANIDVAPHRELLRNMIETVPAEQPYAGTFSQRAVLRTFTSSLIGRFMRSVSISPPDAETPLKFEDDTKTILKFLMGLIRDYVILNPRLATQQHGERKIVRTLFNIYLRAIRKSERQMLPPRFHQALADLPEAAADIGIEAAQTRLAIDIVASFTDDQAAAMYRRFLGVSIGSVVDMLHA